LKKNKIKREFITNPLKWNMLKHVAMDLRHALRNSHCFAKREEYNILPRAKILIINQKIQPTCQKRDLITFLHVQFLENENSAS
jgi:hypothetical protein